MRADPKMTAQFCEDCGTELENDIDYEGRGVSTCPKCAEDECFGCDSDLHGHAAIQGWEDKEP
jgi:hypothetical protein